MEFRPLGEAERAVAHQVFASVAETSGLILEVRELEELRALPASCRGRGGEFWVVDVADSLIGTIGIRPLRGGTEAKEWEIKWLAMLPAWRGMGIGRMLVENALQFAAEKAAGRVRVSLHTSLVSACGLFRSLNFQPIETINEEDYQGAITFRKILTSSSKV